MALGADGVQIGSRFVASKESSAHAAFKNAVLLAKEGDTQLTLKELTPVRLLKNKFYQDLQLLYNSTPTTEDLKTFLGKGRAKRGMFEGDLEKGELEIGQIAGLINEISSSMEGNVEYTLLHYIVRDHDREKFETRKQYLIDLVDTLNSEFGSSIFEIEINDQYYNMKEMVVPVC